MIREAEMTQDTQSNVLLAIDSDDVIVPRSYNTVEGGGIIGIAALCDDGSARLFVTEANPTYRQYYAIEIEPGSTVEETRKRVLDATGWSEAEEFPWAETDDKGDLIPGTDTAERLQAWLDSRLDDNYDLLLLWGRYDSTEYAPGFELMSSFPKTR
jgi:hypothetical protein